ncbi:glycosyltransferase [Imperialibacter sp.]|uniref:glycosyltransferase n=2 Tax=Imperialibacter sp. TaxID=2038411 RepID=UPI0032F0477D
MLKKQIVIGSVLKPVDDIRHYHKLALSMTKTNKYGFNIIGFNSKNHSAHPDIIFTPLLYFKRISFGRLFAPARFFLKLVKLKPELIIVNTSEFLIVSCLYQIIFGTRIVYDIQENYQLNIKYLSPLPTFLKPLAAAWVRLSETISAPFISHFTLAENSYTALPFIGTRWTVLQNKALPLAVRTAQKANLNAPVFLVTGTLSLTYGVREAIDAFLKIHETIPGSQLHLCGKVPDKKSNQFIAETISSHLYVTLTGGSDGVPYETIQSAIAQADFGLVFYPNNPAINECFPTKIWEYMSHRLPIIIQEDRTWTNYCLEKKAAVILKSGQASTRELLSLLNSTFYPASIDYSDIYWTGEEQKLIQLMNTLVSD